MKVTTLVENSSISSEIKKKHGLSFYIETQRHKILFDLGSDKLFLENAQRLGIDIDSIDIVVISHGHKDHGGALNLFLARNKTAKVYIRQTAFEPHYIKVLGMSVYVGLDEALMTNKQIVLTGEKTIIDDQLQLFSEVTERDHCSPSNNALYVKRGQRLIKDNFEHEQSLMVTEYGKSTLFAGCAHNGIANIQDKAERILGYGLTNVIAGFHLYNPVSKKVESEELILGVGNFLGHRQAKYFTCHCTGKKAFNRLKIILGEQISYLSAGSSIEV